MKKLLTTLLFAGMAWTAQAQCDSLLTYETDQFSGRSSWSNKESIILSDNGIDGMSMLLLMSDEKRKTIIWIATSTEVGCVDQGNKVEILFTDGERMALNSESKFNCKGKATMYFGDIFGKSEQMQKLSSTPIDMIRVHGSRTLHAEKFKPETAEYFRSAFNCMAQLQKQ